MTHDWSIQEIAKLAGTTSRTLRHYGDIGLLSPSRIGTNGYRYYDADALLRLQRILLLRDLGLSLPAIAEVLAGETDDERALTTHLHWLQSEKSRLDRQISSVEMTIITMKEGGQLMAERMLDGFDHTVHKDEVEEKWGAEAYAAGDTWWGSSVDKAAFTAGSRQLQSDWSAAAGLDPASEEAQELAQRQVDWLRGIPGTPGYPNGPTREYLAGLGEMYVADERFAANYGGVEGARFVRAALVVWAERNL